MRIEEDCLEFLGNPLFVADYAFGEIAVVFQAARDVAGADAVERAFEQRDSADVEAQGDIRGQSHFAGVADQAEAGDVGQGVDWSLVVGRWPLAEAAELCSAWAGGTPAPAWAVVMQNAVMTSAAVLFSVVIERVAASIHDCFAVPCLMAVEITPVPSALVNSRRSPGWAPPLVKMRLGIDEAGDGISEFGFFVADAVAADDRATCFHHFRKAAGEDLLQNLEIAVGRETYVSQGGDGTAAHGVDVAQGVGGGDLAEGVRVVHDGSEEIDGLHQRDVGR